MNAFSAFSSSGMTRHNVKGNARGNPSLYIAASPLDRRVNADSRRYGDVMA